MTSPCGRSVATLPAAAWLVLVVNAVTLPQALAAGPPEAAPAREPVVAGREAKAEQDRRAELLASDRWRRAMFEFDAWLEAQPVYSAARVAEIRRELAGRIAGMSSFELEYLLETISAKLDVLETPAARDARVWLGRYLEVMSDAKRADVLREVPDILDMTAAELEAAVQRIGAKRAEVERRHDQSLAARRDFGQFQQAAARDQAAARARLTAGRDLPPAFSPYRGPPAGAAPFADAFDSPATVGASPWGSFLALPIQAF